MVQDKQEQQRVVWNRLQEHHSNLAGRLSEQKQRYLALCQELNPRTTPAKSSHDLLYRDTDILHQVLNGVMKHLITWIKAVIGEAEIDARCRRFPPNHHIRLFMKDICNLSQVTGTEHDQILPVPP